MLDDDLLDVYNVLGASNSSLEEETFEPKHKSLFKWQISPCYSIKGIHMIKKTDDNKQPSII
jgi:hypothetical protein